MAKKQIEFSLKLNHTEFDTKIQQLQQKLQRSQSDMSRNFLSNEVQRKMSGQGLSNLPPNVQDQQQRAQLIIKSAF